MSRRANVRNGSHNNTGNNNNNNNNSSLTSAPRSHPAEQNADHRQFLIRSLERNDTELAALMELNRSLHAVKNAICRTCGEWTLLDLGQGKLRLSTESIDSLDGDALPVEGQELCVDFLLRHKLRHKLLNRLARRLLRVATAMDGNDVSPPGPPRYGDLRLHLDPAAVQEFTEHWQRQEDAMRKIQSAREVEETALWEATNSNGQVEMGLDVPNQDSINNNNAVDSGIRATGSASSSGCGSDTNPSNPSRSSHQNRHNSLVVGRGGGGQSPTGGSFIVPPRGPGSSMPGAPQPTYPADAPVSASLSSLMMVASSSKLPATTTTTTASMLMEEFEEDPLLAEYELLRDYQDAYEKEIDPITGQSRYTILDREQHPHQDDYVAIRSAAGVGAIHRSMSLLERETEFQRWRSALLTRIPEQPTLEELGLQNRVFYLKERRKRAREERKQVIEAAQAAVAAATAQALLDEAAQLEAVITEDDNDPDSKRVKADRSCYQDEVESEEKENPALTDTGTNASSGRAPNKEEMMHDSSDRASQNGDGANDNEKSENSPATAGTKDGYIRTDPNDQIVHDHEGEPSPDQPAPTVKPGADDSKEVESLGEESPAESTSVEKNHSATADISTHVDAKETVVEKVQDGEGDRGDTEDKAADEDDGHQKEIEAATEGTSLQHESKSVVDETASDDNADPVSSLPIQGGSSECCADDEAMGEKKAKAHADVKPLEGSEDAEDQKMDDVLEVQSDEASKAKENESETKSETDRKDDKVSKTAGIRTDVACSAKKLRRKEDDEKSSDKDEHMKEEGDEEGDEDEDDPDEDDEDEENSDMEESESEKENAKDEDGEGEENSAMESVSESEKDKAKSKTTSKDEDEEEVDEAESKSEHDEDEDVESKSEDDDASKSEHEGEEDGGKNQIDKRVESTSSPSNGMSEREVMDASEQKEEDEEDEEIQKPIKLKPISLIPIPSFHDQDLHRIRAIHAEMMTSSIQDHARRRLEEVTRDYNAAFQTSNQLYERQQKINNQLASFAYEQRKEMAKVNDLKNEYNVHVAIAKNRYKKNRHKFEQDKLNRLLPSRNGHPRLGSHMIKMYMSRGDPVSAQVADCLADVVDAVDGIAHGMLWNEKYPEQFVPPPAPSGLVDPTTGETYLERFQRMESGLRKELASLATKMQASEEERQRCWKKMLKTKAEFDVPHLHVQGTAVGRSIQVDAGNINMITLPNLRNSTAQTLPQEVVPKEAILPSFVPAARTQRSRPPPPPSTAAHPSISTNPLTAPTSPGGSLSKYSAARVRERISADGTVAPVSEPKKNSNGLFQRPAGRTRKGMVWDYERGIWIPST